MYPRECPSPYQKIAVWVIKYGNYIKYSKLYDMNMLYSQSMQ